MRRKQIYLDETTEALLRKWASLRHVSEATVVREALGTYLSNLEHESMAKGPEDPLARLVGLYKGGVTPDGSMNHDKYLYRGECGCKREDESL